MKRNITKYHGIRKCKWDGFWHATYIGSKGYETWDRISIGTAKRIAARLFKQAEKKGKP